MIEADIFDLKPRYLILIKKTVKQWHRVNFIQQATTNNPSNRDKDISRDLSFTLLFEHPSNKPIQNHN